MTLGGLALAVGILVDDATVTIENINYHLEHGEDVEEAILNGAHEIAVPAFVSTLAICIVFVPMFMLAGIARYLFVPLAEAVVFAMLASYVLSRTLVPTLAKYWLSKHDPHAAKNARGVFKRSAGPLRASGSCACASATAASFERALHAGPRFAMPFLAAMAATALLAFPFGRCLPGLGQDFFPSVDAGQIKLHVRARTGTRIEETATLCDHVEADHPRGDPGASEIDDASSTTSACRTAASISPTRPRHRSVPGDADILVNLKKNHHPTDEIRARAARSACTRSTHRRAFAFLPADIVSQILNFGLPAPIDVQIVRLQRRRQSRLRERPARTRCASIPGVVDLRIQQAFDYPTLNVDVDRSKAALLGLTRDRRRHEPAGLAVGQFADRPLVLDRSEDRHAVPGGRADAAVPPGLDLSDLATTPVTGAARRQSQLLANLATFRRTDDAGGGQPLRRNPGDRHLRRADGAISATSRGQINAIVAATQKTSCRTRHSGDRARADQDHEGLVQGTAHRPGRRHRARLPADRRELPVLARSVHHHHGAAGGARAASSGCCS